MARAMFAPVIGSPASKSQKIVWRYSSSATVAGACASVIWSSILATTRSSLALRAAERAHHVDDHRLRQRHHLARRRGELRAVTRDEGERVVQRLGERRHVEAGR